MNKQFAKSSAMQHNKKDIPLQMQKKPRYEMYQVSSLKPQEPNETQEMSKNVSLQVLQAHEYSKLETTLSSKLKNLVENIDICKEKNHLKDKEVQSNVNFLDKLEIKIRKLEEKLTNRENVLHKLSIKCKDLNDLIAGQEQKIKMEMIYQHEQEKKYQNIQEQIVEIQRDIRSAQAQLERRQKLSENLQEKEEEQERLKERLSSLHSNQKMIEYQANNEKSECQQLQKKMENLKKVLKQRTAINKSNAGKLAKLNKQIHNLESFVKNRQSSVAQIKSLELELGELNQELLLINEEISELNFKILRKRQTIAQLRSKNEGSRIQLNTLTNQTPTFPSKELYSQQPKMETEEAQNPNQALKNIEQLISRYERIKSKDQHKY